MKVLFTTLKECFSWVTVLQSVLSFVCNRASLTKSFTCSFIEVAIINLLASFLKRSLFALLGRIVVSVTRDCKLDSAKELSGKCLKLLLKQKTFRRTWQTHSSNSITSDNNKHVLEVGSLDRMLKAKHLSRGRFAGGDHKMLFCFLPFPNADKAKVWQTFFHMYFWSRYMISSAFLLSLCLSKGYEGLVAVMWKTKKGTMLRWSRSGQILLLLTSSEACDKSLSEPHDVIDWSAFKRVSSSIDHLIFCQGLGLVCSWDSLWKWCTNYDRKLLSACVWISISFSILSSLAEVQRFCRTNTSFEFAC